MYLIVRYLTDGPPNCVFLLFSVNLGGWLVLEPFITPVGSLHRNMICPSIVTEHALAGLLRKV